ncbi:MGDG synthase family glycosyltransferase [Janibacter sp. G349]|uniref:MGDG synthase family glycosyltransferase n=1 Tax=unclassified Janibacter TaxID=2649294 RepID=UPI003B7B16B7
MSPISQPRPVLPLTADAAPRVVVVTGTYGAGHNCAAREISRVLTERGCRVNVLDVVDLLPWRLGPALRAAYYAQLRTVPGSWGTTLDLLGPGTIAQRAATGLLGLLSGRLLQAVGEPDLVVTTHPFGAQMLGHARAGGRLAAPVVTYLTDTSVHSLWVHPGADLHLAVHEVAAEEARALGGRTAVVHPLVDIAGPKGPVATPPPGIPSSPWALVTGGSLGMGDLVATARDIRDDGRLVPVVLCGTDERLRRRLDGVPGVVALGWRDDVPDLMATATCVVQNAGGFTSLQAMASGTPVITYRPLAGHGVTNCANLDRVGLVPWARTRGELSAHLAASATAPRASRLPVDAPEVGDVLVGSRATVAA